jgi:hypothetical protein
MDKRRGAGGNHYDFSFARLYLPSIAFMVNILYTCGVV